LLWEKVFQSQGYFMSNLQQITDERTTRTRPLVLLADDDPDTRFLFRTVLEMRGYCVIEAADGEETVGAAQSACPDLILMDGSLPRLSGLEAARQIRRSEHIGHVPIVFISGHARAAFIEEAREAGCDEYLVKPLDLAQLEDVLEKYCVQKLRAVAI
jgi:two-component system, cell cycle response regulator DivK